MKSGDAAMLVSWFCSLAVCEKRADPLGIAMPLLYGERGLKYPESLQLVVQLSPGGVRASCASEMAAANGGEKCVVCYSGSSPSTAAPLLCELEHELIELDLPLMGLSALLRCTCCSRAHCFHREKSPWCYCAVLEASHSPSLCHAFGCVAAVCVLTPTAALEFSTSTATPCAAIARSRVNSNHQSWETELAIASGAVFHRSSEIRPWLRMNV